MSQVINVQPTTEDINSKDDIFFLCSVWINENYGLRELVLFRDLLLGFTEAVEQYSNVEYKKRNKNNTENDNPYIEKIQIQFCKIQLFIQQFENSFHLTFGLQEYQNMNITFFKRQTTLQPGLIFTDSHAEWLIRMRSINNFVESEIITHNQLLEKKNRGLLFNWNPFRIEDKDLSGTEQTLIESVPEKEQIPNKHRLRIGASIVGITTAVVTTATFIFCNN